VRYVLEGSVRKAGQRLRVTGQLIDAETGTHIWADRFDGQLEDVFDLQDRITAAVVGAIAPGIRLAEMERAARKRPESLDAYDHFLRAQAAVNRFGMREADASLAAAIALAQDYPIAKAMRAWLRTLVWHPDFRPTHENSAMALRLAEDVLAAPDADIEATAYAGYVLAFYGDAFEDGLAHVRRAVELCPNCVSAWGSGCLLNAFRGRAASAIADAEQALRLNPRDPLAYRVHMGMSLAYLSARRFDRLLACIDAARAFQSTVPVFRLYEIAGRALLGQDERARDLAAKYLALYPEFGMRRLLEQRRAIRAVKTGLHDPLFEGLAVAGLPD
jgi:tetratricopeptide (TPR) repeat protein